MSFVPIRVVVRPVYDKEQDNTLSYNCCNGETVVSSANLPAFLGSGEENIYVLEPVPVDPETGTCCILAAAKPFWHLFHDPTKPRWSRGVYREAIRTDSGIYVSCEPDEIDWADPNTPVLFGLDVVPKATDDSKGGVSIRHIWVPDSASPPAKRVKTSE